MCISSVLVMQHIAIRKTSYRVSPDSVVFARLARGLPLMQPGLGYVLTCSCFLALNFLPVTADALHICLVELGYVGLTRVGSSDSKHQPKRRLGRSSDNARGGTIFERNGSTEP